MTHDLHNDKSQEESVYFSLIKQIIDLVFFF